MHCCFICSPAIFSALTSHGASCSKLTPFIESFPSSGLLFCSTEREYKICNNQLSCLSWVATLHQVHQKYLVQETKLTAASSSGGNEQGRTSKSVPCPSEEDCQNNKQYNTLKYEYQYCIQVKIAC